MPSGKKNFADRAVYSDVGGQPRPVERLCAVHLGLSLEPEEYLVPQGRRGGGETVGHGVP